MTKKFSTLALGTILGLGALSFTGAGASAAAMLTLQPAVASGANAASDGIIHASHNEKWKKKKWKYSNNYKWKHRKHRRGYNSGVYLSLPLIIGGAYAANRYYGDDYYDDGYYGYDDYGFDGGLSSRHVRYCLNKYKSYKPRNNTWVSYSGQVKKCYSPYM
jgi:hypothetical protein